MPNPDILKGRWSEIKGDIKAKWGKLTNDDLTEIAGNQEKLMGFLQKRYGYAKEEAEREIRNFMSDWRKSAASDILVGRWSEIKGDIKARWGKLTNDDLTEIAGSEEKLIGFLQKRYGYASMDAEREFRDFMNSLKKKAA